MKRGVVRRGVMRFGLVWRDTEAEVQKEDFVAVMAWKFFNGERKLCDWGLSLQ